MALRFKFLFKEFCASLKLRTRRTSGFALRATPPFAKIFDFVQNGSSWRAKSASWILLAVQAEQLHFKSAKMHFFHSVRLSHWRISQTDVCSMLRKIRYLFICPLFKGLFLFLICRLGFLPQLWLF